MKIQTILIFTLIMLISCKGDDDNLCSSTYLNHTTLENEYGCENPLFEMQVNWEGIDNNYILITNQNDFEEIVSGSCIPEIDFTSYDLVLVLTGTSNLESYNYNVIKTCQNTISIVINIEDSGSNEIITVFNILIPKLETGQIIETIEFL